MGFTWWQVICQPRHAFNVTFDARETQHDLEGIQHYTWRAVRRQNINRMFKQLFNTTLFILLAKAFGTDPNIISLRYGRQPTPDQFGIMYHLTVMFTWIMILFISLLVMALWHPLFKWLPASAVSRKVSTEVVQPDGTVCTVTRVETPIYLQVSQWINTILYYGLAGNALAQFAQAVKDVIVSADSGPQCTEKAFLGFPASIRKNHMARSLVVLGILAGLVLGGFAMQAWRELELVRVTTLEYCTIIIPAQFLIGVVVASLAQHLLENNGGKESRNGEREKNFIAGDEKINSLDS